MQRLVTGLPDGRQQLLSRTAGAWDPEFCEQGVQGSSPASTSSCSGDSEPVMEHQNQNLRNRGGDDHRPHWGAGKTEIAHVKRGAQLRVQLSTHWLKGLASSQSDIPAL